MLKFVNYDVVFQEIPNETTLAINISNCPCHCKGCHSPYLAEDIGNELNSKALKELITKNRGISCVAFMGGDSNPYRVYELCKEIKFIYRLKTAWYSGRQELPDFLIACDGQKLSRYDYIKLGPYIEERGPLNNPNTNQRMYQYSDSYSECTIGKGWKDITYKFWRNE